MQRAVLVFLKLPTPGSVKTRLAETIGSERAADAYKLLVSKVWEQIASAPVDSIRVLFDPPHEETAIRAWLEPDLHQLRSKPEITFHPQVSGDLGTRLESAFAQAFADGIGKVAAIGTDCIDLAPHHFADAWDSLKTDADIVFGPAHDGGYYLVALSAPHPEIFRDIPWSQGETLERSIAAAKAKGLTVSCLETLTDIDDVRSWEERFPRKPPATQFQKRKTENP